MESNSIIMPCRSNFSFRTCAIAALLLIGSCNEGEHQLLKFDPNIYVLSDDSWSRMCTQSRIENGVLYPSRCTLLVDDFETFKHRKRILNTSKSEWIALLQSDADNLSQSASVWLYFLSKEKIELVEYALLYNDWGDRDKERQVKFWKAYFARHESWLQ